jgi:hypothetical protein
MSDGSEPPEISAEAIKDLTAQVQRLARAVETLTRGADRDSGPMRYADRPKDLPRGFEMPSLHVPMAKPAPSQSMIEKLRHKPLTLPAATGWGVVAWIVIEIGQAFLAGRMKLW